VFELRPRIGLASAAVADRVPPGEKVIDLVLTASYAIVGRWKEDYESSDVTRAVELLDALGCAHLIRRRFSTLSEGERKRVQIARALMPDPEMLLLDEPAAGLRHLEKQQLANLLRQLRAGGMSVLLVEHDMGFVMDLADRIVVLDFGTKIADGAPDAIKTNPDVIRAYLGAAS
jgi:iron complex transport system ATP-binding protein